MFRSLMTIARELYLYLTEVVFMLKHWVKSRLYIYIYIFGDVTACRRAACVLCAVQSETERQRFVLCAVQSETERDRDVCCVKCRVRLRETEMCVVCSAE